MRDARRGCFAHGLAQSLGPVKHGHWWVRLAPDQSGISQQLISICNRPCARRQNMGEGPSPSRVGVQSVGLYKYSVCPQSHACSQPRPPSYFLASFPFHLFVVPLGPEFLFPDLPVHPPHTLKWPRCWESPPPESGWSLSQHTHPVSAPGSRAQSGQKQEGIPLHGLSYSCPSGREPEDAPE